MTMKKYPCSRFIFLCGIFCPMVSLGPLGRGEIGCPPPEDVKPCVCRNSPYPVLECFSMKDDQELRSVFQRSERYTYREVHISFSSLKYLPQEMFDNTVVKQLYIKNSTLNTLFDSPPDTMHALYKLHLENTRIKEISQWELISQLSQLEQLDIFYNPIESIDSTFGEHVPKSLTRLSMVETGTKEITEGAFLLFPKLDKIEFVGCKLKQLSRGYFPNPFNARFLYFDDNELVSIPSDLFTNMPKLMSIGLRDNFLKTIPESAFNGVNIRTLTLLLEGNPLKCDCSLLWLVKNKPVYMKGSCATPIRLHDRELRDLVPGNFKCHKAHAELLL